MGSLFALAVAKMKFNIRTIDDRIVHCFTFHNSRHPNLKGASLALVFGAQL